MTIAELEERRAELLAEERARFSVSHACHCSAKVSGGDHHAGCPMGQWIIDCTAPILKSSDLVMDAKPASPYQPKLRPKNSAERKAEPIHSGVMLYFPDALAAVARISKAGNDKHNPGEPLHWSRGKSMDHLNCMVRHSMTPEGIDPDSGEYEQAQVAWRALAQLQLLEEKRLKAAGIVPYSGIVP